MKLFDYRNLVPASLVNKTAHAVDALSWVSSGMVAIQGASVLRGDRSIFWDYDATIGGPGDPCVGQTIAVGPGYTEHPQVFAGSPSNFWERLHEEPPLTVYAQYHFAATPLAAPEVFERMDDDDTILQAKFEVSCSSSYLKITQTKTPPSHIETVTVTDNPELSYVYLAQMVDGTFEYLGEFPGVQNGIVQVIDGTAIAQAMWARKRDGVTLGYVIVVSPPTASGFEDGLDAIIHGMRFPPNVAPMDFDGDGTISCAEKIIRTPEIYETLTWTNPTISGVHLKVAPPSRAAVDACIPERWPPLD